MTVYTICVTGNVDAHWSEWFDGLTITNTQAGDAMISGEMVDQAALHGTLNKIRDLNLALISVTKVDSRPVDPAPRTTNGPHSHVLGATGRKPMSLLRRHPLVAFFALAYLISWSVVPFGLFFTPEPLIAALIVVPLTQGRAGLRQWARFVVARHRVHRLRRAGRPLIRRSADRVP